MIDPRYVKQIELLLRVIPFVAQEKSFGLKGGTAINLFMRDFPRISVDIDLVYLPFDAREIALARISEILGRIKDNLERNIPDIRIRSIPISEGQDIKLICQQKRSQVKIEVNAVVRGHFQPILVRRLSDKVETEFQQFAAIQTLSKGEVFGSKICAALDRQHPRDLFDVKLLLDNEGLSDEIRLGFLCALLSHPRPIHEILKPAPIEQKQAFDSQFQGMSFLPFSYEDHTQTFDHLTKAMKSFLTPTDKEFLLSFKEGTPKWSLSHLYEPLQVMPSIKWKLFNLQKLRQGNKAKHERFLEELERKLV